MCPKNSSISIAQSQKFPQWLPTPVKLAYERYEK